MTNVADGMLRHAALSPDAVALRANASRMSYSELDNDTAIFGGLLRDKGVRAGDRVLLIAPTTPEFVIAYLAAHLVGAIVITMNTMATEDEIGYVLDDSGARVVIAWHDAHISAWRACLERGGEFVPLFPGADASPHAPVTEAVHRRADDTAVLLYTSGTTGKPKGVELTVANLGESSRTLAEQLRLTADDRLGTGLPLFHIFGQAVCLLTALHAGCSFSLLSPFQPRAMIEMIRDHELTCVAGVPTMWNTMLQHAGDFGAHDFSSLRFAASGGAALPREIIREFSERFDCVILEGYGLTESTGAATYNPIDREQRVGSVGIALPGTEIEVRSREGAPLSANEIGELYLRGPQIMKGYWNNPQATAKDLVRSWLKTGDLGRIDEDGYVYIVDRAKDLIIRGGYNVYPGEVEDVLYGHPDILEVAVVGTPDRHYGEEVAAVITLRPGARIDTEHLRAWAKGRLSAYKVPHRFAFVDELPKGPTGKILKRQIDRTTLTVTLKP